MRTGAALIEVLMATTLAAGVLAGSVAVLHSQSRIAQQTTQQSERNDAARSALLLLRAELEAIEPSSDLRAVARDSIAVRIFRGRGIVCGREATTTYLRYRGLRAPDAAKDSLLEAGVEQTTAFTISGTRTDACAHAPEETVYALRLPAYAPLGSVWLLFESGSFHLSQHALRYRRGTESRQPLTAEVIDDRGSAFTVTGDSTPRLLTVTLRDRATGRLTRSIIRWLNAS